MRKGFFSGGSCSGIEYESINNAHQVFVVNRSAGVYEVYDWEGVPGIWAITEEAAPTDQDRLNAVSADSDIEIIQHPNPGWTPVPLEE
jgi:hypothetical protein